MRSASLRYRLLAAWLVFIMLVLPAAAIGLRLLFERSITHKAIAELTLDLRRLAAGLDVQEAGVVKLLDTPTDPQYVPAYSGRYWQVSRNGKPVLRSPSLWGYQLNLLPRSVPRTGTALIKLSGPDDQNLFGIARTVRVGEGDKQIELQIVSAIDDAEVVAATKKFSVEVFSGLAVLALLLLLAAAAHVTIGLQPLKDLRTRLALVRNGEHSRLEGAFPSEVMPLVAETNALLEAQDEALDAARTRAGNLAHGLKTPLAVMSTQSRQLRRRGDATLADEIDRQIETMRRHVERELARTRARGTGTARYRRIDTGQLITEIASALQHLPKGQQLDWRIAVNQPLRLTVDRADFVDIMGNLLDNSQKWAKSRVLIKGFPVGGKAIFTVEDDGPGVPEEDIERVLQRGERADETVPGSGLGLTIVNDLVLLYGGKLELARSTLGGLRAAVVLPYQA